jgi:hypothetical protein
LNAAVQPLAIDLKLLRDVLLPEVRIAPGRMLAARVVTPQGTAGARGSLSIAGYLLDAELPSDMRAGQELRLMVRDVSAHRVLLQIADLPTDPSSAQTPEQAADVSAQELARQTAATAQTAAGAAHASPAHAGSHAAAPPQHSGLEAGQLAPPAGQVPLPGGGMLTVTEREAAGGGGARGGERHGLTLRYDAPALGPIELRFALDPATLRLGIQVKAGAPHELAERSADELRAALTAAVGRAVSVTIDPRREPIDVYA